MESDHHARDERVGEGLHWVSELPKRRLRVGALLICIGLRAAPASPPELRRQLEPALQRQAGREPRAAENPSAERYRG